MATRKKATKAAKKTKPPIKQLMADCGEYEQAIIRGEFLRIRGYDVDELVEDQEKAGAALAAEGYTLAKAIKELDWWSIRGQYRLEEDAPAPAPAAPAAATKAKPLYSGQMNWRTKDGIEYAWVDVYHHGGVHIVILDKTKGDSSLGIINPVFGCHGMLVKHMVGKYAINQELLVFLVNSGLSGWSSKGFDFTKNIPQVLVTKAFPEDGVAKLLS